VIDMPLHLALDMDQLERALQGGPALLLLCATVILGGVVVPTLTIMLIRTLSASKAEVRELMTQQLKREQALMEAVITTREVCKSATAAINACTRVLRSIMGSDDKADEGGDDA
jgi:hypothetical protein